MGNIQEGRFLGHLCKGMYKGTVIVKDRGESTNRLAMATFWRTSIMLVNSAHAGGGGGVHMYTRVQ